MRVRTRNQGFTMVELMISVAILGILASIAIPAFTTYQNRTKRSEGYSNLSALANLEKGYFAEYNQYVAQQTPGFPVPGGGLGAFKRPWDPAAAFEFSGIGYRPDGDLFHDYTVDLCATNDCFTISAFGDTDGDGFVSLLQYVHPSVSGVTVLTSFGPGPGLGLAFDPSTLAPIYDGVAVNYNADLY